MGINADGTLGLSTWSSISDNPPTDGSFPTSNMTIPLSTWTEIAFTWSPQGSYAYINGVQDGYSPLDFYPALNPTDYVYLNCWGGSAPIQMDELRISDVARTQFNVATTPKLVAANASTLTISGYGFDATTANDSVTFDHGVTGTVTSASLTSLTVSVSGLSSLTAGTALDASVTVDGVSSGSLVQVATLAPVVTTGTTNGAYEYTPDANTILLDHFDGTTQATYLSGNVAYTPGFSGLGQAISFPSGAWAQETFSGWYNWTSYDGTSITKPSGTIELWVNPTADNVGILQMQWNDTTSPPPAGGILAMGINADGTLGLSTWSSISDNPPTDGSFPTSNMTIPLSTWTEIAFTWSPQGSYAYINGVQDGYSPLDFYPALNPTDYVYLNCWGGSAPIQMDELRISDVARTQFNVATTPKLVAANASTLTISGYGFDATTANDSVTFDHGVTGTVTSASLTSLTVSVSGLSSLIAGTALDASVTVDGVSSGSLVQVTTISPVVTSSTANVAANATSMIISGYGFDTTTANDSVTFNNGVTGTVTSASLTSLTVTVNGPSSLTAGTALDASVTVDGLSSGSLVQVATIAPVVTPSTAALATNATSLTISGYGFDTNPGKDSVTFNNGATGTVTSASLTSLTVRVSGLTNLTSGTALEASVTVDGVSSATPVPVATVLSLSVSAELNATTFSGSNQVSTQATYQSAQGDNFVSVNTSQTYQLSGWACSGNGQGGAYDPANRQYFGFACYDSDKNPIEPYDVAKVAGATDTTLAQELKPGATTIVLTNANGWYSGSTSYERSLAWYGYKNSSGYVYPNYTYTRNVLQNAWNQGGITGNVITLSTPWAGPDLPAGTAVRNATSGASYNYAALYSGAVSAAWTQYTAAISGVEQNGALTPGVFWPGTTYIKPVILFNNQSQADNLVTWRDVSWAYTSPAVFQSGDTVALHVGGVTAGTALTYSWTQLSGLMVCLQNAQTATASFVVPPATSGFLTFQVTVSNGTTILQQTVAIDVALSASAALNATTFSGSNQVSTQATYQSAQGDNFVPVNTNQTYQLSGVACSGNGQGGNYDSANRQYFGFACYDSDKLEIEPYDVAKVAGAADTTLAQELKPGATTIVLTNTGGWYSGSTSYGARWPGTAT